MKKIAALLIATVVIIIIIVLAISYRNHNSSDPASSQTENNQVYFTSNMVSSQESESSQLPVSVIPERYILKEYQGYIGVFEEGKDTPLKIIETEVALLPETDQAQLEEGIVVVGKEELARITEDYGS